MRRVVIDGNVSTIGADAFRGCVMLKEIYLIMKDVERIVVGDNCFENIV